MTKLRSTKFPPIFDRLANTRLAAVVVAAVVAVVLGTALATTRGGVADAAPTPVVATREAVHTAPVAATVTAVPGAFGDMVCPAVGPVPGQPDPVCVQPSEEV